MNVSSDVIKMSVDINGENKKAAMDFFLKLKKNWEYWRISSKWRFLSFTIRRHFLHALKIFLRKSTRLVEMQ